MDRRFFERIKPLFFTFVAIAIMFGLMDASPHFYGPFEFAEDHRDFAPWFSGIATTLGVWVALFNGARQVDVALAKETADEQRVHHIASRNERALFEAACGAMNTARLNAGVLKNTLEADAWRSEIHAMFEMMQGPGEVASSALKRFPIHLISRPAALEAWYRLEVFHAFMLSGLDRLHTKARNGDSEELLERVRAAIIGHTDTVIELGGDFARALGVDAEVWQFRGRQGTPDLEV